MEKLIYLYFHNSKKGTEVFHMVFIADSIGTEYKKWRAGDTIFISSPTGSGKTTFVLISESNS